MMKKIIYAMVFVLMLNIALAGVTNPLPSELNLKRGETGYFKFQVQAVASPEDLECRFDEVDMSPLLVEFDENNAILEAGTKKYFIGSVRVPKDISFGKHSEKFCVRCNPVRDIEGNSVNIVTCGLPINVNVVDERIRENMTVVDLPQGIDIKLVILFILVGITVAYEIFYRFTSSGK